MQMAHFKEAVRRTGLFRRFYSIQKYIDVNGCLLPFVGGDKFAPRFVAFEQTLISCQQSSWVLRLLIVT